MMTIEVRFLFVRFVFPFITFFFENKNNALLFLYRGGCGKRRGERGRGREGERKSATR